MSVVSNSGILGQYETAQSSKTSTTHKTNMDQSDFLTLLVAQLEHQDPLSPMDDKDMTSQLAQFSSLEQLTNINTGIKSLVDSQSSGTMLNAVAFIGKGVKADGYSMSKSGGDVSTVYYSLGETVTSMQVNVYGEDGTLVRTDVLGSKAAGEYQYTWDGKDSSGNSMADGTYGVAIVAEDSSGAAVLVQSKISGEVTGLITSNSTTMLQLKDGRTVDIANVTELVAATSTTGTTTTN